MYKKTTLKNGLRVITIPIKNAKSVTVSILVGTGSKYEKKDISGISHFLEHMFFKGTKKRPKTLKISDIALDWISDMFLNSKFEEEEIQREKGVIVEELNMYLDTPTAYVSELFEDLLYKDQPAGWRIVGEKENILSFNREKILDYFKNHYSTKNTVVCIAGDVNVKQIQGKINKYFGKVKTSHLPEKVPTKEEQSNPEVLVHYKKTDQTHFCNEPKLPDL